jgi:chromosome transmission fidelity protein 18
LPSRDLDGLSIFETAAGSILTAQAPTRYAVRQVLEQELTNTIAQREAAARLARFKAGNPLGNDDYIFDDKENKTKPMNVEKELRAVAVKKDFFGRVITPLKELDSNSTASAKNRRAEQDNKDAKVWVTFHEGLNNAVRKPISLREFLRGL